MLKSKQSEQIKIMYPDEKAQDEKIINPFMFYVLRPFSFRLSMQLTKLKITATTVTIWSLMVLSVGIIVFLKYPVLGSVFLILYLFLDVIDGNIARLSQTSSKLGEYLDESVNTIAGVSTPLVVSIYVCNYSNAYIMPILFGVGIVIFRLLRRISTDKVNILSGKSDRTNVADTQYVLIQLVATTLNALMIPILLPFAIFDSLYLWLALYFAYNLCLYLYTVIWSIKKLFKAECV
jgi:phosphatidylglycerophosphate synthase